ncbi:type IX secretion system motor protein PorM/GldM [Myroides phaeus]|uniref:Gliding motility-associated protein GldM n=1 Tax=Myroides phaeus TaxID=702745 RepID=A0A1G8BIM6_9FLAO|nr:gliding motility protein GldM [Myroides phaeus]MEC4116932.1 gliding motility protein GldM [Myroides phaeus]SDH32981.1 gliding motility-associated protein GldM [Myroides phaeus]
MAKQKLTPRQKMINLMYLVFIAMMALQMSKEVLSAFGMVNEKFESANSAAILSNDELLNGLGEKATDDPTRFKGPYEIAKKVSGITKEFYAYVDQLKSGITESFEGERTADGKLPAERMDKGDLIDAAWFAGDNYSEEGQAFINAIEKYKTDIKTVLADTKFQPIVIDLDNRFDINDVKDSQGITKPYLNYNFQGFPAIATLTKLSTMQNDAKVIEHEIYNSLLGNTLTQAASMRNYEAFVISDKSTYFAGEAFKGKVVLGRYDKSTVPTKVTVNGQTIDLNKSLSEGQVNLNFNTGNVGEHDIKGLFTFMEEGSPVEIPIKGNYVVVPKPNSANISADKMNVVYRGVANPLTISFAGISDDKVVASAPGLSKAGRVGAYILNPQAGREVSINVSGTLPDGQRVSDSKVFRIKDIPSPRGTVRGEYAAKGPKSNLEIVTVGAKLDDFDFDVNLTVTSFVLQVPGEPSVVVAGNRMNDRAKAAIRRARIGDIVVISDIKVRLEGAGNYALKKTAPCTFEIN